MIQGFSLQPRMGQIRSNIPSPPPPHYFCIKPNHCIAKYLMNESNCHKGELLQHLN